MVLFLRSSVISNNDFGYRASLLPQFFLLLLGVEVLASWWTVGAEAWVSSTPAKRRMVYGLLALGVAGTIYQAVLLRSFLWIEEPRAQSGFSDLPVDAYEARAAFAQLDRIASRTAVVEFNPVDPTPETRGDVVPPFTFYTRALLMDSGRQVLNAEPGCATEFGGDARPCAAIAADTARLYGLPAVSAEAATAYCRRYGVSYLAAGHRDPVWAQDAGWLKDLPAIVDEPGFRILRCD
jgi:hypothetical protein